MYKEIQKKKKILEIRAPFSQETSKLISELNLNDMVYTNMRLNGSLLTREDIREILNGNVVREMTIDEHIMIGRYREIQKEMASLVEMRSSLSMKTLKRLYSILMGISESEIAYRHSEPTIYELSYTPPCFEDIPEQMDMLMGWIVKDVQNEDGNELLKIAYFHNRFVEIFPFKERNFEIARVCVYYYMMTKGYPIFAFNFSESEYNGAIAAYLKNEDISPLYRGLERSLYNKLDLMMQITDEDAE